MKLIDLVQDFSIFLTNEEKVVLEQLEKPALLQSFQEREQVIINNLIRKSVVSKVKHNEHIMVVHNDYKSLS